jgi:hypothetical protein
VLRESDRLAHHPHRDHRGAWRRLGRGQSARRWCRWFGALMKQDKEQGTRQLEDVGRRERAWKTERPRENLELELDFDRAPAQCAVSEVDRLAATVHTPDVAAPDPSCGFERVFGPDWRTRYPAIAGGVDRARRKRTSPTAPADDPRRSGPPEGEQGSAFENRNSGDGWLVNQHLESATRRRKTVVSRGKDTALLGAPL